MHLMYAPFHFLFSDSPSKLSHAYAINEALQGKIRLLENRIGRLQDELETSNLMNGGNGMAIMVSSKPNKKPKDPNKPVSSSELLRKLELLLSSI